MKIFTLFFVLSISTFCFSMDCSYKTKSSETKNIMLFFHGSEAEIAQIDFQGSDPSQYFILTKRSTDGLEESYTEFAIKESSRQPLQLVKKSKAIIHITHVKGGNLYRIKINGTEFPMTCTSKS